MHDFKLKQLMKNTVLIVCLFTLQACSSEIDVNNHDVETRRWYTTAQMIKGEQVFLKNCASCHGIKAQATENWRVSDKNGIYPPPPLNGTAHTWHHPINMLKDTVANGTSRGMPAWKTTLNDEEIEATLAWIVSHWPDKVYNAWRSRH
jgi:mono/diheme cytochrome c family protein